jgi:hypothetical protein
VIFGVACLIIGVAALWLAISGLRDFRNRKGDFSEWIISDAKKENRTLWLANAWTRIVVFSIVGLASTGVGLSLMLKN